LVQVKFGAYQGKFFLNENGQWVVQCSKPVKIILNDQPLNVPFALYGLNKEYGNTPSFCGFTIITEDGTQYIFGGDTSALEYSIGFYQQISAEWTATAWYLKKIIYPDNTEADFTYQRKDFINQMGISVYEILNFYGKVPAGWLSFDCSNFGTKTLNLFYNGMLISPIYLSEITTKNCNIRFNISSMGAPQYEQDIYTAKYNEIKPNHNGDPNGVLPYLNPNTQNNLDDFPNCLSNMKWYRLDGIMIHDQTDKPIKEIRFAYSGSNGRLFLTEIREVGGLGDQNKIYAFEYNQANQLPKFLANKTDHWGFFNNTFADIADIANYYSKREPNTDVSLYGILTKITYPTGGYTRFIFESHQYRRQLNNKERWKLDAELSSNKYAGGVRIKQIYNSSTGETADEKLVHDTNLLILTMDI
jgi:hypothetical protein